MTNIEQVREQMGYIICSSVNGAPELCKPQYCAECAFRLSGIDKAVSLIQPLIDQAINHEANEWIAGISEALGQGYFVYDPKLGKTGCIKWALDRVIDQARAEGDRRILAGLLDILEINKNDPLAIPVKMKHILEQLLKETVQALKG